MSKNTLHKKEGRKERMENIQEVNSLCAKGLCCSSCGFVDPSNNVVGGFLLSETRIIMPAIGESKLFQNLLQF
jgi:hypothetical protein